MTKRRRKNIGILGGTFNPIHLGHLLIAQDALEQVGLDCVRFIPTATPPHKQINGLAAAHHRVRMVTSAIQEDDRFEVDDIEIKRGGKSYSIDTLMMLKERLPNARFFFIIGSDSLQELHLWKDVERLLRLCIMVTIARPGFEFTHQLTTRLGARTVRQLQRHLIHGHACGVASREIRARVSRGLSIRYLVPDSVADYIRARKLYR